MDQNEFEAALRRDGFGEIVIVERPPNGHLDVHTHPFEAKALILAGEISLNCDGTERRFRVGEIFHLANGQAHAETYGPDGVRYVVGRR